MAYDERKRARGWGEDRESEDFERRDDREGRRYRDYGYARQGGSADYTYDRGFAGDQGMGRYRQFRDYDTDEYNRDDFGGRYGYGRESRMGENDYDYRQGYTGSMGTAGDYERGLGRPYRRSMGRFYRDMDVENTYDDAGNMPDYDQQYGRRSGSRGLREGRPGMNRSWTGEPRYGGLRGNQGYGGRQSWGYGGRSEGQGGSFNYDPDYDSMSNFGDETWFGRNRGMRGRTTGEPMGPHAGRGPRGYQRSDDRIREDANEALSDHPWLDASDIQVTVSNGEITLEGTVDSRHAKRMAEDALDGLRGVRDVQNRLRMRQETEQAPSGQTGQGSSGRSGSRSTSGRQSGDTEMTGATGNGGTTGRNRSGS